MAAWARCPNNDSDNPLTWARRLKILRPFARWLQQFEPGTEVPDDSVFGSVDQRLAPHIYTEEEIADLLVAARGLRPPLRGATYETLFGLLAATGLRVSEAVHLLDADVDLRGPADGPPDQVRQVPPGTTASEHAGGAAPRTVCCAISRSRVPTRRAVLCRHAR
jgi:integrase